jgi:hypothetical protein
MYYPAAVFAFTGIILQVLSAISASDITSAALGILGITFLWDALEFFRQEKRVRIGRAPANPRNPRHARFLSDLQTATILNPLDRDPTGRPIAAEEIKSPGESAA